MAPASTASAFQRSFRPFNASKASLPRIFFGIPLCATVPPLEQWIRIEFYYEEKFFFYEIPAFSWPFHSRHSFIIGVIVVLMLLSFSIFFVFKKRRVFRAGSKLVHRILLPNGYRCPRPKNNNFSVSPLPR